MIILSTELIIFGAILLVVTVLGLSAAYWKEGGTFDHLEDWGLGGRKFGSFTTWFLIGGDIFTAYTFVALPALIFEAGATGFFALPYTILIFPLAFLPLLRMWSVSKVHRYVTPADFVRGRYGSKTLALVVALTGIGATMPYIALQVLGLEAVLRTMGLRDGRYGQISLIVAFGLVAICTILSGLRAPALIAWMKAGLIYPVIVFAVIYLPWKHDGWGRIFDDANVKLTVKLAVESTANLAARLTTASTADPPSAEAILLSTHNQLQYVTLALSSALALFLYPHVLTGVLASSDRNAIKRNMTLLPAFTLVLGLFALLGYAAIATGVKGVADPDTGKPDANTVLPSLFAEQFPPWFAGVAFAAIGIGALVPAAIMSIAAANLWTRNIYKEYLRRDATAEQETRQAKIVSFAVKAGAVAFIVGLPQQETINYQLIGGVIILQTLPMVAIALYTRWLHRWGLLTGWAVGLAWGVWMLYSIPNPATGAEHFGGRALELGMLSILGWEPFASSRVEIYPGFVALVGNLVVAAAVTIVLRRWKVSNGEDETKAADYHADGSPSGLKEGNDSGGRRATL